MDQVRQEIVQLLNNKIGYSWINIENAGDLPLTGKPFYLSEIDLVYLLFEIEKKYDIRIEEKYLVEYGFSTVNKIADIVMCYI